MLAPLSLWLSVEDTEVLRILLDTMIYDSLSKDPDTLGLLRTWIYDRRVEVLVTPTIVRQLQDSPFGGIPGMFDTRLVRESVLMAGLGAAGDRVGSGEVMRDHRGSSKSLADAMIADVADVDADVLVTEDGDFLKRMPRSGARFKWLDYAEFSRWLRADNVTVAKQWGHPLKGLSRG